MQSLNMACAVDTGLVKVLIFHGESSEGEGEQIRSRLPTDKYTCTIYGETCKFGEEILPSVYESLKKHDRIILLVTDQPSDKGWLTLAAVSALERVSVENHMRVIIAYTGVSQDCVGFLKSGLLSVTPSLFINLNEADGYNRLLSALESPLCLDKELPAGNLHLGLVHSNISGFVQYAVEELKEKMQAKCDDYQGKNTTLIKTFMLVVPESCKVPSDLKMSDESRGIRISREGDDFHFTRSHMDKPRDYHITIYTIENNDEKYYVCAQVPTVLTAILHLAEKHLGKINVAVEHERFVQSYQHMIDAKGWNDFVKIVRCKDIDDIPFALFNASKAKAMPQAEHPQLTVAANPDVQNETRVYLSSFDTDENVRTEIETSLKTRNITCSTLMVGKDILHDGDDRRGWIIFILSKDSLEAGVCDFNVLKCLTADVDEQKLRVLLVLSGVEISEVPQCIFWVTHVSVKESQYKEKIVNIVLGKPVEISRSLPAGDVVPGLCWAYIINYLMITLPSADMGLNIKHHLTTNNIDCGYTNKLIVVWIKSCDVIKKLHERANESDARRQVTDLCPVEIVKNSLGGQINRPFKLSLFKYTDKADPAKQRCFIAEYCTPMCCINYMETEFAGISSTMKQEIGARFKTQFDQIMSRENVKTIFAGVKVSLILFDDTNPDNQLIEVLEREIMDEADVIGRS